MLRHQVDLTLEASSEPAKFFHIFAPGSASRLISLLDVKAHVTVGFYNLTHTVRVLDLYDSHSQLL